MVFSSPVFLFAFLPLTIGLYFLFRPAWRNAVLLLMSLLFYAWGEPTFVLVMLASIGINYFIGQQIGSASSARRRKGLLIAGVASNLVLLGFFKYAGFIMRSVYMIGLMDKSTPVPFQSIPLPVGISFFTFQAMSYIIDVYRGSVDRPGRFIDCALYISLFPQLIAGPIVRYRQIAEQIRVRTITGALFASGIQRFIIGLARKVLLADNAGFIADKIFAVPMDSITPVMAWLGLVAYTIQIYFDFSGYSDMAIGLGRMFGFEFQENFNFPYVSRSIKEFWRRWHISLSTWFRDYLYLPLGGSRLGAFRTYFNLSVVFVLCGLWHGAAWNFVVWGMLHGVYLIIERLGWSRVLERLWRPLQHIYTLGLVMIGWVFFRIDTLPDAIVCLARLAGCRCGHPDSYQAMEAFDPGRLGVLAVSIVFCFPVGKYLTDRIWKIIDGNTGPVSICVEIAYYTFLLALFLITLADVASNTYHPFIYFRF